jgi:transcriptional regulator with XRE-family HTH domain
VNTANDPLGLLADLRELVTATPMSLRQIALRANITPGYLSQVLKGDRHPSEQVIRSLDAALGANGILLQHVGGGSLDDELFHAADAATRISHDGVAALAATLAATRNEDDVLGSTQVIDVSRVRLARLVDMVHGARGSVRGDLVHVAGQWAQFVGWLMISTGQFASAQAVLRTALEWATEAGDPDLIATVVSYQAHRAWLSAVPGETYGLSMTALRDPRVHPAQRAYDLYQAARAAAVCGEDLVVVDRLLADAEQVVESIDTTDGPMPPWQYYRDRWQWLCERGLVHRYAGHRDPARIDAAIADLTEGIGLVPEPMRSADWYAEYLVHQAAALTDAGRHVEASAVLAQAGRIAADARSARVTAQVNHGRLRILLAA